jgi:hypothetical protein
MDVEFDVPVLSVLAALRQVVSLTRCNVTGQLGKFYGLGSHYHLTYN